MKKFVAIATVATLMLPLVDAASIEKPSWEKGDYWKYKIIGGRDKETIEKILGKENITVGNTTYHCIVARQKSNTSRRLLYYDRESLGIVKEIIIHDNETEEKVYDPPFLLIQYPLFIGKKWNVTIQSEQMENFSLPFECTGKEEVSTKAGKFSCYVVEPILSTNESVPFYQAFYVSGTVGNIVRIEIYMLGNLTYSQELLSFRYSKFPAKRGQSHALVVAAIAIIAVTIVLLGMWKKRIK